MKILLLFPPMSGEKRYGKFLKSGSYLPPLGLAYIASILEKDGHKVKILDGSVNQVSFNSLPWKLKTFNPDIVGLTTQTPTFNSALKCAEIVKNYNSKIVTVFGGPHPSALPEETVTHENVDYVVFGEGEETTLELVNELVKANPDIKKVKGLYFKEKGEIKNTGERKRLNLDNIPFPAWHLLDLNRYTATAVYYKRKPFFSLIGGRGCPYECTFCDCAKVFKKRVTMRSANNIEKEIIYLKEKYGAKEITFWDDTFTLNKKWVLEVCEVLEKLNIYWSVWARADIIDEEIIRKMAKAGCWLVSFGMESGNQKILSEVKKNIPLKQSKKAVQLCHKYNIEVRTTWILGLPRDCWRTINQTINFAIEIDTDYAQFHFLTVYPNTELWDTWRDYGILYLNNWDTFTMWYPTFIPFDLTRNDLFKAQELAYKRFYLRFDYWINRLKKIKSYTDIKRYISGGLTLFDFFKSRSQQKEKL